MLIMPQVWDKKSESLMEFKLMIMISWTFGKYNLL